MENINPYVFISKKMKVINTKDNPNMSLKMIPPQSASKNIFSGLFKLNFINNKPIIKFIMESRVPIKIDLKTMPDIFDERNNIVTMRSNRKETTKQKVRSCFSFFIISSFQNRLNESVHTGKDTKKCKYYC
jgi:hypothetical protein